MTPWPSAVREEAMVLRGAGLTVSEVARRTGVARSTVSVWVSDPDGAKAKARRLAYAGTCVVCGGPTNGSNGRARAADLCMGCRTWPRERVVAAMRAWAAEHGRAPTCQDWQRADVDHPCSTQTQRWGWNELLLEAGLPLRCDRRPETMAGILARFREGASAGQIAREFGTTQENVLNRLRYRGLTPEQVRAWRD